MVSVKLKSSVYQKEEYQMLIDYEGNKIVPTPLENNHVKVVGKSGSGKTYWSCRHIEILSKTMPVLIVDFSGSYTEDELNKNNFVSNTKIWRMNAKEEVVRISASETDIVEHIADSLIATFKVESMMQRKILREACEKVLYMNNYFSFFKLFEMLKELEDGEDDSDYKKNTSYLKSRLYHLRFVDTLQIIPGENNYTLGIHILQLSEFPERIRKALAQFFLEVVWREIRQGSKDRLQIVLDEFQLLRLEGTALEKILREGRKYGVGATLLSQYAPKCDAVNILEQAATSLYFSPNDRNVISVAKIIEPQDYKKWIMILKKLERGSCILAGRYSVNGYPALESRPLICKVI